MFVICDATALRSSSVSVMPATHSACSTISAVTASAFGCAAAVAATARWDVAVPIPRAAADANTPRLAYADLIEEDGDDLRAAFIRAQVALAGAAEYDELAVSAKQLNPDVFHGWGVAHTLSDVRVPDGYKWEKFGFRRGFPW